MRMLEEEEVEKILKKIDNRINIESNTKNLSIIIMNKKLFKSFDNYMLSETLNSANDINYDWYNDGRRFYRGLLIIRTKHIRSFLVK